LINKIKKKIKEANEKEAEWRQKKGEEDAKEE